MNVENYTKILSRANKYAAELLKNVYDHLRSILVRACLPSQILASCAPRQLSVRLFIRPSTHLSVCLYPHVPPWLLL